MTRRRRAKHRHLKVHAAFLLILLVLAGSLAWRTYFPVLFPKWVDRHPLEPANRGDEWGYVNSRGQWAIPARFETAERFTGDRALVQEDGVWGWIDRFGEWATPHRFDRVSIVSAGKLTTVVRRGRQGYVNDQGELVIDTIYDKADPFSDGLAGVRVNGKCGYIDETGRMVIEPVFGGGHPFIPGTGLTFVYTNGKPVVIDRSGQVVLGPEFVGFSTYPPAWLCMRKATWIGSFYQGLAPFNVGGHTHTANRNDGASAALGGKWGYINQELEVVVEPCLDWPGLFERGVAEVVLDGEHVCIDIEGNVLNDAEVEAARRTSETDTLRTFVMESQDPIYLMRRWVQSEVSARVRQQRQRAMLRGDTRGTRTP